MVFGLLLVHRQLDMAGFAVLAPDPKAFALRCLVEAALAATLVLGLLTPLALAGLLLSLSASPTADSLGVQVARIVCWGLLLAGAGRSSSLDARLLAWPRTAGLRRLYVLAAPEGRLAWVRLLVVALFWGLAVSGVSFHATDPFWLRGQVLQVALALPYMSEHYPALTALAERHPAAYDVACRVALYAQGLWQLFLLPLFYLPGSLARTFAIVQGVLFFLISTVALNLGYLGPFELCLWALVFASLPRGGFGPRAEAETPPGGPVQACVGVGLLAALGFVALGLLRPLPGVSTLEPALRAAIAPFVEPLGLRRVNVFNQADLGLGATYLVLLETDEADRPLRTVPFLDRDGGRLDYLRNDYLYFSLSLAWQRTPRGARFVNGNLERPTERTLDLLRRLVDLDLCLTGLRTPRHYRAEVMSRALVGGELFPRWTEPRRAARVRLAAGPPRGQRVAARLAGAAGLLGCFDLPPGHAGSQARAARTLAWARRLESP